MQGGKYKIERVLGQGGFGNTYIGYNTVFNERVAIKEFFMQGINDRDENTGSVSVSIERNIQQFEEQREKFKKEALRIRKLDNPHIVKVHDLFEENGTVYYVMDYVDGENLSERLKRTGKSMTEQEVSEILPQILDALKSVHDAGIWHLDLKPANVMVDSHGNVKLIDFGASKQLNAQKGGATTSTAISYTNGYAPREQMEQNYDKFGPWTDIYALGSTLYNLLTNKRPPLPTDIDDDISEDKHVALPFPKLISADMKRLILQMMHTNSKARPQSVSELLEKLNSKCVFKGEMKTEKEIDSEKTIISITNKNKTESKITYNDKDWVVSFCEDCYNANFKRLKRCYLVRLRVSFLIFIIVIMISLSLHFSIMEMILGSFFFILLCTIYVVKLLCINKETMKLVEKELLEAIGSGKYDNKKTKYMIALYHKVYEKS